MDLPVRLSQHNNPDNDLSKTTKRFKGPWILVWLQKVSTCSEATILERRIKKRGIGRFLEGQSYSIIRETIKVQQRFHCKRD